MSSSTLCLSSSLHLFASTFTYIISILFLAPTHSPPPTLTSLQHSSHSDDSEVENIMQDPHHQGGHGHHHHHHDHKHQHHYDGPEPHDADREADGEDRPLTPSHLQPPVAGRAQSDLGSDPSLPQSRSVEFEIPSPVSPSRPKSPWGRFDPYGNNEVTRKSLAKEPGG